MHWEKMRPMTLPPCLQIEMQWGGGGGGRWVYNIKLGPNNEEQYKARFVAKGYSQIPDIDYQETFSPTARMASIRTLMQIAVQHDLTVHQMDVKTAFLNAPIDCELYVEQPEGYEIKSKNDEKLVLRLKKSLYGLKQSGRNWNHTLHTYLIEQGYSQSRTDSCVYKKHSEGQPDDYTIVVIWVDDLLLARKHESTMTNEKDTQTKVSHERSWQNKLVLRH